MGSIPSTERFTNRVEDYVRYRPGYPPALIATLKAAGAVSAASTVADVASGTGISSELFLDEGCTVFAVEPNHAMRAAAERRLAGNPRFHSVKGTAEATTLSNSSVDLTAAGQAFHWFDPEAARTEFRRILRPPRWVALFWNERRTETTFLREYEGLLRTYGTDYEQVRHTNIGAAQLQTFFGAGLQRYTFPNEQVFDFEGLRGRLLSSSYAPAGGHPQHEPMLEALQRLFDVHQEGGRVRFLYDTRLCLGILPA